MERIFRLRKHFRKSKNPVAKLAGVFCGVILECYLWKLERKYGIQFEKELARYQVPHDLLNFPKNPKLTHAFSVFEPELDESLQTMKSMIDFLQKY